MQSRPPLTQVVIYSRPGCHLCDEMKALISRVAQSMPSRPVEIVEIDISGDPALEALYGLEIPVLLVEGKKAAKYRIAEVELRKVLLARDAEGRRGR